MGVPGGYTGRAIPGYYPAARKELHDSEAGPGRPAGPGVGGHVAGASEPCTHPLQPPLVASGARFAGTGLSSGKRPPLGNKGEIKVNI